MAIQGVKGSPRTAYVIKGTYQPQSYGQLWAQQMSQGKYKLWEEAQKEAIRQMNLEETDYQTKLKIQESLRQDLRSEIDSNRNNIEKLKVKQAEAISSQSKWEATPSSAGTATRISKSDSDQTILEKVAKDRRIAKDSAWKEYNFYLRENQRIEKEAAKLDASFSPTDKQKAQALRDTKYSEADMRTAKNNYNDANTAYEDAQANLKKSDAEKAQLAKPYRQRQSTVGGTAGQEKGKYEIPDYQKLMDENQATIDRLTQELQDLETPTRPESRGLIERTRDVYNQQLAGSQQRPVSTIDQTVQTPSTPVSDVSKTQDRANRIAELEALGADQKFIDDLLGPDPSAQPTALYETPKFGQPEGDIRTVEEILNARAEAQRQAEANYVPTPMDKLFAEKYGFPVQPLHDSYQADWTFEEAKKNLQEQPGRIARYRAENAMDDQEYFRQMKEAEQAAMPEYIQLDPMSEQQKRLQTAVSPYGALGASYYPPVSERDLEFQAMQMEGPVQKDTSKPDSFDFNLPKNVKYKGEVFNEAVKMPKQEVQKIQNQENKPEWAKLTEGLFNPEPNATQEDIDKLLQNAWDQITLTYSDDRENMKKAHVYLIALDNNLNMKPE